jgi:hypothetical protein
VSRMRTALVRDRSSVESRCFMRRPR